MKRFFDMRGSEHLYGLRPYVRDHLVIQFQKAYEINVREHFLKPYCNEADLHLLQFPTLTLYLTDLVGKEYSSHLLLRASLNWGKAKLSLGDAVYANTQKSIQYCYIKLPDKRERILSALDLLDLRLIDTTFLLETEIPIDQKRSCIQLKLFEDVRSTWFYDTAITLPLTLNGKSKEESHV